VANAFSLEALPPTTVMVVAGPTASGKSDWALDQISKEGASWSFPTLPVDLASSINSSVASWASPSVTPSVIPSVGPSINSSTASCLSSFPIESGQNHASVNHDPCESSAPSLYHHESGFQDTIYQPIGPGRIINGDSMQVYRGLDLLTAMPSNTDQASVNHDLYGFLCPYSNNYDVFSWSKHVHHWVHKAHGWGQRAWIVGGTGFYLKTLSDGLSPMPMFAPEDKDLLRRAYTDCTNADLKIQLAHVDQPSAEKIVDRQRMIHALIVHRLTEKPLSWWHQQQRIKSPLTFFRVLIWPSKETVLGRAEKRWQSMVQQGVYEQVRAFCTNAHWQKSPLRHAIGLHPIWDFLQGKMSEQACRQQYMTTIAQYIKQQRTWFRGQFSPDYVHEPSSIP
jgi:tRNA dimethylallyltransferase